MFSKKSTHSSAAERTICLQNDILGKNYYFTPPVYETLLAIAVKVKQAFSQQNNECKFNNQITFTQKDVVRLTTTSPTKYHYFENILDELRCYDLTIHLINSPGWLWRGGFVSSFEFGTRFTVYLGEEIVPFYLSLNVEAQPSHKGAH